MALAYFTLMEDVDIIMYKGQHLSITELKSVPISAHDTLTELASLTLSQKMCGALRGELLLKCL